MRSSRKREFKCMCVASVFVLIGLTFICHGQMVMWPKDRGGNDHFYLVVVMDEPISWMDANNMAQSLGGHLVTITSEVENKFVFRLIDDDKYWYKSTNWRGPWIGAYKSITGGSWRYWRWVTDEPFVYQNWDVGQPNNFQGNPEDYVAFGNQQRRIGMWNDVAGDFREIVSFVLEYSDPRTRPVQWPTYIGGNQHFYNVVHIPNGLTWDHANHLADMAGGYLATITNAEENAFVFLLIRDPVYWNGARGPWIGGYQLPSRLPREGWRWITGEPFLYTNWSPGQPNDSGGADETRLHFGWGASTLAETWNDQPASYSGVHAYVVEREPTDNFLSDRILYYSFDQDGEMRVVDVSGNGRHGTVHGPTLSEGVSGHAYSFDGKDDYIRTSEVLLEDFTFSAWLKTSVDGASQKERRVFISGRPDAIAEDRYRYYEIRTLDSINNRRIFTLDDGMHYYALQGNIRGGLSIVFDGEEINEYDWQFEANAWTRVTLTHERGTFRLYKDGSLTEMGQMVSGSVRGSLFVGGTERHRGGFWRGMIDEVTIFNRVLNETEVKQLYDKQHHVIYSCPQ